MRPSGILSLLTATLLATSGVFAYYDDEYSGALTARDVFEDDVLQERSFDDIDEYDARDYVDDEYGARDYLDDEYDARDFFDEDELTARLTIGSAPPGSGPRLARINKPPIGGFFRPRLPRIGRGPARKGPARTRIQSQNPGPPQGDSVSTRELLEELLEARDQAEQAAARRRRKQRQRLRKAGKRKSKKLKAAAAGQGAADPSAQAAPASAPAADAAAPAPAA
ncbi:hypothetical protein BKA70DRAFT_1246824 [Coprinopsis sp. MPI-PUGE-AT-0042]|nr:hypothetical protein BKA70DRAFT_1246824 [Coprinopsis sp. MPI-PUGE-AT-0042]